MSCRVIGNMIICGPRSKPKPCEWRPKRAGKVCGKPATKLCDWPVPGINKTCSNPMCDEHAIIVGANKDYCWIHESYAEEDREESSIKGFFTAK